MASAQLSSPRRAGADSDLKETEPTAPGALLGERSAGRRAAAAPRAGRGGAAVGRPHPSPARPPCRRAHPGPPRAPTTHPREGAVRRAPGVSLPSHRPRPGAPRLPGACQARGLGPSWCRHPSQPETSAKLGVPGHGAGAGPASRALCGRPFLLAAEPREPANRPTRLPKSNKVHFRRQEARAGGSWKPSPLRHSGRGPAQRPRRAVASGLGCAAAPLSARDPVPPTRRRPAVRVPAATPSCRRGPPPRPPRPGVTLRPRGRPAFCPAPAWGGSPAPRTGRGRGPP